MALSPRALYRSYLKHLQHVPDPHIWRTHQPYFRSLLDRPGSGENHNDEVFRTGEGEGETSRAGALRESRRLRGLQRARKVGLMSLQTDPPPSHAHPQAVKSGLISSGTAQASGGCRLPSSCVQAVAARGIRAQGQGEMGTRQCECVPLRTEQHQGWQRRGAAPVYV